MSLVTIVGRGHSGTRAISKTLSESGVYMGEPLNGSGDLLPPDAMYEACRVMARHVEYRGRYQWDFSRVLNGPVDPEFSRLIESYLSSVLNSGEKRRGWKIPETTLVFPWITRLFPDINYIYWIRDPRDGILKKHKTDDLSDFGIPYEPTDDLFHRLAISWKYQAELIKATPRPAHMIKVRFEDFVLRQDQTLARLESFLGFELARIDVFPEAVGRWHTNPADVSFELFFDELVEHGYDINPQSKEPEI